MGWLIVIGIWFGIGIIFALVFLFLQYRLSKCENKWLGLILPIIFFVNMIPTLIMDLSFLEELADLKYFGITVLIMAVTEGILLGIYYFTRKKLNLLTIKKTKSDIEACSSYNQNSKTSNDAQVKNAQNSRIHNPAQTLKNIKIKVVTATSIAMGFPVFCIVFIATLPRFNFTIYSILVPYLIGFTLYMIILFKDIKKVSNIQTTVSFIIPFIASFLNNPSMYVVGFISILYFIVTTARDIIADVNSKNQVHKTASVFDKAEYHFDSALDVYTKLNGCELEQWELDEVLRCGGQHIGIMMTWIISKGYFSNNYNIDEEVIAKVKSFELSGVDFLLKYLNGVLMVSDIIEPVRSSLCQYYSESYIYEYEKFIEDECGKDLYDCMFSEEYYQKFANVIEQSFKDYVHTEHNAW